MSDPIKTAVAAVTPDAIAARHYLHQNPELSDQEQNTAACVAARLHELGLDEVRTDVGGHGIIATLHGRGGPGGTFALRADMDALPILEQNDIPYKSQNPGVMHACGHDGHTATLLGTVATLVRQRETLCGTVRFLFQPAEETVGGAARLCAAGAMDGVDAIVALHGWPGIEVGQVALRSGPMMASSDTFDIVVKGQGAHAAMPHISVDPIMVAAHTTLALQTLSSREISPVEPVVVTVAQIHAGTAYNIIPGEAVLKGTVRCLSNTLREEMPEKIERIARGICAAFRAECTFRYQFGTKVTVNDAALTELVEKVGEETLGAENVLQLPAPSMGAEDFAMYLDHAPGMMFRLGVGKEVTPLHTPTYNFGDGALPVGIELLSRITLRYLAQE